MFVVKKLSFNRKDAILLLKNFIITVFFKDISANLKHNIKKILICHKARYP